MKARLEGDERWKSYASQLGQTKFAVQQTELACLMPPSQRSKARFMNVGGLVDWGGETLALVDDPSRLEPLGITAERVRAKLGWLEEYREELAEWSAYQAVIDGALDFVRRRGLYPGAGFDLAAALPAASGVAGELREELIDVREGRVVEGPIWRAAAGDDGGAGVVLREVEGVGGWAVQERLHGVGAEPGRDGLEVDGREHRRGAGAVSSSRRRGLVPQEVGAVGAIAAKAGIRSTWKRNKTGMNVRVGQAQLCRLPASQRIEHVGQAIVVEILRPHRLPAGREHFQATHSPIFEPIEPMVARGNDGG